MLPAWLSARSQSREGLCRGEGVSKEVCWGDGKAGRAPSGVGRQRLPGALDSRVGDHGSLSSHPH